MAIENSLNKSNLITLYGALQQEYFHLQTLLKQKQEIEILLHEIPKKITLIENNIAKEKCGGKHKNYVELERHDEGKYSGRGKYRCLDCGAVFAK